MSDIYKLYDLEDLDMEQGGSQLYGFNDLSDVASHTLATNPDHVKNYEDFIASLEGQSTIYKHWNHLVDWFKRFVSYE